MPDNAGPIAFGEWRPDLTDINTGVSTNVLNVVPRGDGYGPFPSFVEWTQALPGPCRGIFHARNADGSVTVFGATADRIYRLDNTTFAWVDVSKGGSAYSIVATGAFWQFVQFNTFVIAVQVNTAPQVYQLGVSSAFADLGGSPPQAAYIAVINRFLVLGGILGFPYRVQWSGLNATTTWDNVTAGSNFQDLADGGRVLGIEGGDQYGVVLQDASIRSMIFAPGATYTFEILRIATNDGLLAPYAATTAADKIFFCSPQGFKRIIPGGYPETIGREKVDRTFLADFDSGNPLLLITADPTQTRIFCAYKSKAGNVGLFDKVLCYDIALDRWTPLVVTGEYITSLAKPGLTLEALDPIAPGAVNVTGAADNGSGLIRLVVTSTSGWSTGDIKAVSGVTGTTEANGNWTITVIDGTHIDLQGSAFVNAYVSGGIVGGRLDDLPFSLDSVSLASLLQVCAVDSSNRLGFFNGPNLEATLETPETSRNGRKIFIESVRPVTDCATVVASVGFRETPQAALSYTTEVAVNDIGDCPVYGGGIEGRYVRGKLRMPAEATWSFAAAVEPVSRMTGWR